MNTTPQKMKATTSTLVEELELEVNMKQELWQNRSVVGLSLLIYNSATSILNKSIRKQEIYFPQLFADVSCHMHLTKKTLASFLEWLGITLEESSFGFFVPVNDRFKWFLSYCHKNFVSKKDKDASPELSLNSSYFGKYESDQIRSVTEVIYSDVNTSFFTEEAAARGSLVHDICNDLLQQSKYHKEIRYKSRAPVKSHPYTPNYFIKPSTSCLKDPKITATSVKGYIESFMEWAKHANPYPLMSEKIITMERGNKGLITGQLDFLGFIEGRRSLGILDWKTSVAFSRQWIDQVVMYAVMLKKIGLNPKWGGTMRLKKDGKSAIFDPIFMDYDQFSKISKKVLRSFWDKYLTMNLKNDNGR